MSVKVTKFESEYRRPVLMRRKWLDLFPAVALNTAIIAA